MNETGTFLVFLKVISLQCQILEWKVFLNAVRGFKIDIKIVLNMGNNKKNGSWEQATVGLMLFRCDYAGTKIIIIIISITLFFFKQGKVTAKLWLFFEPLRGFRFMSIFLFDLFRFTKSIYQRSIQSLLCDVPLHGWIKKAM